MQELELAIGTVFAAQYEIQGALGEGGFGTVYKARQLATGQSVAIKVLRLPEGAAGQGHEKRIARFQREMQICGQMHHPNIVRLIDSGHTSGGVVYSVFEFVPGKNLAELLVEEGRLDPAEARHLMMQVVDALACAHTAGVVHRDLKPANIMVVPTGARRNALVLDFGIGALTQEARRDESARITLTNESIGTPSYAAPEQLRNQPLTPRSDLYAWGLVFLECLTGKRVISGETVAEVIFKQLSPDPIPIPDAIADHSLGRILRRTTAKDPAAREVTAEGLLRELEGCDVSELRPRTGSTRIEPALADAATVTVHFSTGPRAPRLVEGERRQITALCCTLGAASVGPRPADIEELDHVLGTQQEACAEIARRLEGHVAGALGNSVLFYFGYPTAREDDARRAARAALTMAAEVRRRSVALEAERGIRVDLRVGLHTGLVVSRELSEPTSSRIGFVVGTTPKLSARLAALAEPGEILASGSARLLLRKFFVLDETTTRLVDDTTAPVEVFALRDGDPAAGAREVPLVGRERELSTLLERWDKVRGGAGQAVLVSGEPGIGKSRLTRALAERLADEAHTWLECRAAPHSTNSAFYPIIELIDRMLDPRREVKPDGKVTKLEALLSLHGFNLAEAMPLFTPLLSLSLPSRWAPLDVSPQKKRELTRNAVLSLLFEMAEKEPVVLVIEDLHWADPSTIELLGQLVGEVGSARVLALFTARPEFSPPWSASLLPIQLGRFAPAEVAQMVLKVTSGRALPPEVLAVVTGRTDGVPLFVEELVLTMIETGALVERDGSYALAKPLSEVAIPATLRDSLVARLDRLGRAKETAQVASAIGREFTFELLRAVSPLDEAAAQEDLDRLVATELVYRKRRLKNPAYIFKHAMVRDAAYESMLKRSRVDVHARIAKALEEKFPEVVGERPELVAHHLAAAEQKREAIGYAQKAATAALMRSANAEAITYARQALGWLEAIEPPDARAAAELALHRVVVPALMATRGWIDPELKAAVDRSQDLLDHLGEGPHTGPTLFGLLIYYVVQGTDRPKARAIAEQILAMAQKVGDAGLRATALSMVGSCAAVEGELAEARTLLEGALALYNPVEHRSQCFVYGQDARVAASATLGWTLWPLGHPDRAMAVANDGVAWAEELKHAGSIGLARMYRMLVRYEHADVDGVAEDADFLLELANRHGLAGQIMHVAIMGAWTRRDLEGAKAPLAMLEGIGAELALSIYRCVVARIEAANGLYDAAIERIDRATQRANQVKELFYVSALARTKGIILLQRDPGAHEAAEACFRDALSIAQRQGARMRELEATTSLCQLLLARDRLDEARAQLAPIYHSFTEGLDTVQLVEARALLDRLGTAVNPGSV